MESKIEPTIIVHGGAGGIPDWWVEISTRGVKNAALKGNKVLTEGGSALDAVVAAVSVLEDDPAFNAGKGSSWTSRQEIEMDASVMDGKNLDSGAVTCVRDIANPVQLARAVMEKTDHCFLADQGANEFAEQIGIPKVNPDNLKSKAAKWKWDHNQTYQGTVQKIYGRGNHTEGKIPKPVVDDGASSVDCDTVGAVALDSHGNLAAATSTGGIMRKMSGRVGDSPVVGAGVYADNESCGVSATGHGEGILTMCLSRRVAEAIERGDSAQKAVDYALQVMDKRIGGVAGLIAISKTGEMAHAFTTQGLSWASVQKGVLSYGEGKGVAQEQVDEIETSHKTDKDKTIEEKVAEGNK